jgi:hypothetical protein
MVVGAGALLTVSEWVVVVVVVGAGFSTTVVHEVRSSAATAKRGVRMISFFIVGIIPSRTNRCRYLGQMYFERRFFRLSFMRRQFEAPEVRWNKSESGALATVAKKKVARRPTEGAMFRAIPDLLSQVFEVVAPT